MKAQQEKIKRLQPIMEFKQMMIRESAQILALLQEEKTRIETEIQHSQQTYMAGIETLNQARTHAMRPSLKLLENSLDHSKEKWVNLFKSCKEVSRKIKAQMEVLLESQRELHALEKLHHTYQMEFRKSLDLMEQKMLDELSLQKFQAEKGGV